LSIREVAGVKRILILAALAGALALPAQASAKTWHYNGAVPSDPTGRANVSFDVVKKKGKKRAKNFVAESIPAQCDNATVNAQLFFRSTGADTRKVKKNKFTFKVKDAGAIAKWTGELKQHGSAVEGTVSFDGLITVSGTARDCHTGELAFAGGRA
jgi:hypothetical protein